MSKKKPTTVSKRLKKRVFDGKGDAYLKHEFRNELIVVREGVSQVLDGLGDEDCARCRDILKPALVHVDRLYEMINQLSDALACKSRPKGKQKTSGCDDSEKDEFKKLKNEYIDRLAHLVRTPLSIASEALSLLLDGIVGDIDPKQKDIIALSKENMIRLSRSIEQIINTPWEHKLDIGKSKIPYGVKFNHKDR